MLSSEENKAKARKYVQEYSFVLKFSQSPSDPNTLVSDKSNYSVTLEDDGTWTAWWWGRLLARCECKEYAQSYCIADMTGQKL